jgi:hypothetical protein
VRLGIGHPGEKDRVSGHVLQNFSKDDIAWLKPLVMAMVEAAPLLAKDDDAGFMSKVALLLKPPPNRKSQNQRKTQSNGFQMRNRGPAQCRQVHFVQRPHPDGGGAGGQLSLLHHRAQCRRCGGARSAAGNLGQDRRVAEIIPTRITFVDIAGLVRGASKGEGLGNQFLANIREVDAVVHVLRCFEDDDITHVEGKIDPISDAETGRDRIDAGRSGKPGKAPDAAGKESQGAARRKPRKRWP